MVEDQLDVLLRKAEFALTVAREAAPSAMELMSTPGMYCRAWLMKPGSAYGFLPSQNPEILNDDVFMERHRSGLARFDCSGLGGELHCVEVAMLLNVNATQLRDLARQPALAPELAHIMLLVRRHAVRLQLYALTHNLANFMRTLALPETVKQWSLSGLREKLVKIGAKVVRHGRYVAFQMAEVAIPRTLFGDILRLIAELWPPSDSAPVMRSTSR